MNLPLERFEDVYFRRRFGAVVGALAVVAILIAALGSGGTSHGKPKTDPRTSAHPAARQLTATERHALAHGEEEAAIDSVLAYTPAVVQGGTKGNEVALTFDDGPGPYTEQLVDTLNRLHVQATFFAIGIEERYFSAGTLLELRSGDVVGDHTQSAPDAGDALTARPARTAAATRSTRYSCSEAPPRGSSARPTAPSTPPPTASCAHLHLLMILWSTDTGDYARPGVQAIVQRALAGAHPGAIILMHDAGGDRSRDGRGAAGDRARPARSRPASGDGAAPAAR